MPKRSTSQQVPTEMQTRFDAITQLTAMLCRKRPSPLNQGKTATWACGIIHALGMVNFLFDSSQTPHVSSSQIASFSGLSSSTMQAKSKQIRDLFGMYQMDPEWTLPSMIDKNPLIWMLEVNGFIMDVRQPLDRSRRKHFAKG